MTAPDHAQPPMAQAPTDIVQVGRQPILDRNLEIHAYELLYREPGRGPAGLDGDLITSRTLLNTVMEIGLERITVGRKAFVNLTRSFFHDRSPLPLDPDHVVLEILEDIEVDQGLLDGVAALRAAGYTLALDDYRFEPHWEPLLGQIQAIKVDIAGLDLDRHAEQIRALKERGLILLAEKVETRDEYERCRNLGFDLFQGYFFAKPKVVSGRRLKDNETLMLRLLGRINDPACTADELEDLIAQDPALSFKLLRYLNSAAAGLPREVTSIREAVVLVGINRIRAWATLSVMSGQQNKPAELLTTGLVRAQLCESLTRSLGRENPQGGYLVGLLSVLDGLLDLPMEAVIAQLPLPAAIATALISHDGPHGDTIRCALALEQGDWLNPAASLVPIAALNTLFVEALEQAEAIRRSFA